MKETTAATNYTTAAPELYMAFELAESQWKLGFSIGLGQPARRRTIEARDLLTLGREVDLAKARFGQPKTAPVKSCYEAGREGFWLHRYLEAAGIANLVVDSASLETNRRKKTSQDRPHRCGQTAKDADTLSSG